jgi:hypothetical protein
MDEQWNEYHEWLVEKSGREVVVVYFKVLYPMMCLDGPRKAMEKYSYYTQSLGWRSEPGTSEYKAALQPLHVPYYSMKTRGDYATCKFSNVSIFKYVKMILDLSI